MQMKVLLILAAASEALTGLLLLMRPLIVIRLLFASEIDGAGVSMTRVAGIGLIALGVACWPDHNTRRAHWGMLIERSSLGGELFVRAVISDQRHEGTNGKERSNMYFKRSDIVQDT
jgi:hypothetical protein